MQKMKFPDHCKRTATMYQNRLATYSFYYDHNYRWRRDLIEICLLLDLNSGFPWDTESVRLRLNPKPSRKRLEKMLKYLRDHGFLKFNVRPSGVVLYWTDDDWLCKRIDEIRYEPT